MSADEQRPGIQKFESHFVVEKLHQVLEALRGPIGIVWLIAGIGTVGSLTALGFYLSSFSASGKEIDSQFLVIVFSIKFVAWFFSAILQGTFKPLRNQIIANKQALGVLKTLWSSFRRVPTLMVVHASLLLLYFFSGAITGFYLTLNPLTVLLLSFVFIGPFIYVIASRSLFETLRAPILMLRYPTFMVTIPMFFFVVGALAFYFASHDLILGTPAEYIVLCLFILQLPISWIVVSACYLAADELDVIHRRSSQATPTDRKKPKKPKKSDRQKPTEVSAST